MPCGVEVLNDAVQGTHLSASTAAVFARPAVSQNEPQRFTELVPEQMSLWWLDLLGNAPESSFSRPADACWCARTRSKGHEVSFRRAGVRRAVITFRVSPFGELRGYYSSSNGPQFSKSPVLLESYVRWRRVSRLNLFVIGQLCDVGVGTSGELYAHFACSRNTRLKWSSLVSPFGELYAYHECGSANCFTIRRYDRIDDARTHCNTPS